MAAINGNHQNFSIGTSNSNFPCMQGLCAVQAYNSGSSKGLSVESVFEVETAKCAVAMSTGFTLQVNKYE